MSWKQRIKYRKPLCVRVTCDVSAKLLGSARTPACSVSLVPRFLQMNAALAVGLNIWSSGWFEGKFLLE